MATPKRREDRRIQRTRQLLQQAFVELVREKGFTATSIQDITERANVSRGTFYLHYTDKYTMLDTFIREHFRHLLESKLPPTSRWDRETLYLLIRSILEYFEAKYHHEHQPSHFATPLVERVINEELSALLLTWLKQSRSHAHWRVSMETMARVVSWGIFGAAIQWSQEPSALSSEQMAHEILMVIMEGMARLAPDAILE